MHTQHRSRSDADSMPNRTTTRQSPPRTAPADTRTATDRAPRTFSHRDRGRLENLIDEWNAAFATGSRDP